MDAVVTLYSEPGPYNSGTVAYVKRVGDQFGAPHHVNWVPLSLVPPVTNWTTGTMGQVFGIAIDDAGNVYFSTTAMYWGGYGNCQRLADPNPATSGAGGTGYHSSGGPAGIYKADHPNLNTVTALTGTVPAGGGIGTNTIPNTGYGIGNIAYAKVMDKLYVSNLEDGKLYCLDPATGLISDEYDPFGADASGAQIAGYGERIFGLAVNYEQAGITRLYYAVLMNDHQSDIWSVELDSTTGYFLPATQALEINLPASSPRTFISDLAFSSRGEMLVAEKGAPHNANVYQYFGKHNAWSLPMKLWIAALMGGQNSAGGVDYGYSSKDTTDTKFYCDTIIWTQSNAIAEPAGGPWLAYGLLSHPLNDYTHPNDYLSEAYMVNLTGNVSQYGVTPKGSFGDVECMDWECQPEQTDICSKTNARLIQLPVGECCYLVEISNKYRSDYFNAICITSDNLSMDNVSKDPDCNWANITYQSPTQVVFRKRIFYDGIPLDSLDFFQPLGTICFSGSGPSTIRVDFIGNPPQFDTVCSKLLPLEGCSIPIDTSCVSVQDILTECDTGAVTMKFRIKNNSGFTMRGLTIYSQNPDVVPFPRFIPIPDLLPGQVSPSYYETTLIVANQADSACFFIAACDQNTTPGIAGPYPSWCCMDSIPYCVTIPWCDPCAGISLTPVQTDSVSCCYSLSLSTNYTNSTIEYLEFIGIGGTQFALFSGWNIIPPAGSSHITIKAPGGGLAPGYYPDFASLCLTGTSSSPFMILVKSLNTTGLHICTDTLIFHDCLLVTPTCANIFNDSLYCSGDRIRYTFSVMNNAPFSLYQVDFRTPDPSVVLDVNHVEIIPPIAPGSSGGPFTVTIDSADLSMTMFCLYLSGHNGIYDPELGLAATECCTDSLGVVCLPMISCSDCDTTTCCDFENMKIPNGITPNDDGFNDLFEILNASCCESISIKVFNRWGNVVYQNGDYQNDWNGVNDHGVKLVQGTYFILLELPTGNRKGIYMDIRY